jgi:uncharacterized protein YndB with AHSA1/START domain
MEACASTLALAKSPLAAEDGRMTPTASPLTVRHAFPDPPERAFDAWVDPLIARRWLFATPDGAIVRCDIDARPDGRFVITDRRAGEDVEHHGRYLEIDRPRRLAFEFSVPKYSSEVTTVRIAIEPAEGGCELALTHENVLPEWRASTEQGWRDLLARLEGVLRG